jgi:hypothetical protein
MKFKLIIFLFFITILTTTCKKRTRGTMTVIKDCTGSYLRYNDKDYPVCNEDKLDSFEDGTTVSATFVKDDKCISDRAHCAMVHGHVTEVGRFRVTKIKK